MLAEKGDKADIENPERDEQRKLDGTRALPIKNGNKIVLRGRSWINDYASNFPEIVAELRKLPVEACVLDGELTFFKKGTEKDVFMSALVKPETRKDYDVKMMLFDVLYVEDNDVRQLPFSDRREILEELVPKGLKHIEVVKTVTGKGKQGYFDELKKKEGEGVILKEKQSPYREGERTREWLKVKNWKSDEAVIVGYTQGEGARANTFGAVILAQKDKNGKWRYVGKTSGFKDSDTRNLLTKMQKLKSSKPVIDLPSGVTVKEWVNPKIVAEVKYYEKTPDHIFRFPDFLRERTDKTPEECKL